MGKPCHWYDVGKQTLLTHGPKACRRSQDKFVQLPNHPDRDAQFEYINTHTTEALAADEPAISVDTKKKELVW